MLPVGDGETVIPGRRPGGVWSIVSEEDAAHLLDVARTWWPLEHLADHLAEVPESPYRGKRRREGVVTDPPCRGHDEGVLDRVEGHALVVQGSGEGAVSVSHPAGDTGCFQVSAQDLADVGCA